VVCGVQSLDREVWSWFVYKNTCPGGEGQRLEVPIEPLVGLMRHPLAHAQCRRDEDEEEPRALLGALPTALFITEMSIPLSAAKQGPDAMFCMSNRSRMRCWALSQLPCSGLCKASCSLLK
jgi:hypothetical protein